MAINYTIDSWGKHIDVTLSGSFGVEEVLKFLEEVGAEIPDEKGFTVLADATKANDNPLTVADMELFADICNRASWAQQIEREAIVTSSEFNAGLTVLFQQFSKTDKKSKLFTSVENARSWLMKSQDKAVRAA